NPTFVRLAQEPKAGQTTLVLEQAPTGWKAGDRLIIPDTRQYPNMGSDADLGAPAGTYDQGRQWESMTVQSVSGVNVTLNSGLKFDHLGARDTAGKLDFLPHIGNLTRNIIIHSESPTGTRGHTLCTIRAEADIRYVLFKDLGRTKWIPLDSTTLDSN